MEERAVSTDPWEPQAPTPVPDPAGPEPGRAMREFHDHWEHLDSGSARRPRRRRTVLAGVIALVVAGAGVGAWALAAGVIPGRRPRVAAAPVTGFAPTSQVPAQAAEQTAAAFVSAWSSGQDLHAADYTDAPQAAVAALHAYAAGLRLTSLTATVAAARAPVPAGATLSPGATTTTAPSSGTIPGPGPGGNAMTVTVDISAHVSTSGAGPAATPTGSAAAPTPAATVSSGSPVASQGSGTAQATWTYTSTLTAYGKSGRWYVKWAPDVLAPNLTATTHPAVVAVAPGVGEVTDAGGDNLAASTDPGVSYLASILAKTAPTGHGTPGIDVELQTQTGALAPGSTPAVLSLPVDTGTLATTIAPTAEAAAESAAGMYPRSAMVVIQPSTGDILAIANHDGLNHTALTGRVAPGSSFKVITSTALFNQGTLTPQQIVDCPQDFTVQGTVFHNDSDGENLGKPFIDDFAQSCNNAFDSQYQHLEGGALATTAQTYYGLNQPWDIGLGTGESYTDIPADPSGAELAQECFGQGELLVSPIAMASVAATVDSGDFHQPILVPGAAQVPATPLPASTDTYLQEMMRAVVTYPDGTGYGVGFGPGVYAKTGTADVGATQAQPNSWMIAFDPAKDIAVAALVQNAGYGASYAGPEIKSLLNAL